MAKSNFIVRGGADFSGIKKGLDQTQKQLNNFQNKVSKTIKAVTAIIGTVSLGTLVKDSTNTAVGVEGAIGNIARNMGMASDSFNYFARTQARALGMAESDAYQYGATFSNLLNVFSNGAEETAKNTEELMRAAAIIASKTSRTYEDVSDRIRSGMLGSTEAIEDLGVYVNISMLESTKAFKKFAGNKSWSQLNFQTQQQIRLAAILEQTYARYGDTLANNTQYRQSQFIASLKDLKLTLGQTFLPIYNTILPALTSLIDKIRVAVLYIQAFFQALFGGKTTTSETGKLADNTGKVAGGLGDANDEAEDLKKSLAGFDELNILSQNKSVTPETGGTNTGGIGETQVELTSEYKDRLGEINSQLETFKAKVSEIAPILKTVTVILGAMWTAFVLPKALTSFGTALVTLGSKIPILSGVFTGLGGAVKGVGAALSGIPGIILLGVIAAIVALIAVVVDLWKNSESFRNFIIMCWDAIKTAFREASDFIWTYGLKPLLDSLGITAASFGELYAKYIRPIMEIILKVVVGAVTGMIIVLIKLSAVLMTIGLGIMRFVAGLIKFVVNTLGVAIGAEINGLKSLADSGYRILKNIMKIMQGMIDFIENVFAGNWEKAWENITDIFKNAFEALGTFVKAPLNAIIARINTVIGALNKIKLPDWIPGIGGKGFNIPQIPKLAKGGIVNSGQIFMAGEAGKEAIVPLERNTEWINELASKINTDGGGDITITMPVYIDNEKVYEGQQKVSRRRGTRLVNGVPG